MDHRKSSLNAFNTAEQTVVEDGLFVFPESNLTGCSIKFADGGSQVKIVKPGLYLVYFETQTAGAVALLKNGVVVPNTESTRIFATLIEVPQSCCSVDNTVKLAVQNTGAAATYQGANLLVIKLA